MMTSRSMSRYRPGDGALVSIVASDFFGALAGSLIHFTMIWWVLGQDVPDRIVGLMILAIFVPFNLGVLFSGVAVVRFGSRKLLVLSKLVAVAGAGACCLLLAAGVMTLPILAVLAAVTYLAMGPSVAADISRVPALTKLAKRRLAGFHALNSSVLVLGQTAGLGLAALLLDFLSPEHAVAIGTSMLVVSAIITWAYFPRDRARRIPVAPVWLQIGSMTRSVLNRLDNKVIGIGSILATVAVMALAEGYTEVILPLDFRGSDLPASALASAYAMAVFAGVLAAVIAQSVYEKTALPTALRVIVFFVLAACGLALLVDSKWSLILAVAVCSAGAWGAGTLTVTTLQESMPASLQAQAISLWQSFVMFVSALIILVTGQVGSFSVWFMVLIACLAGVAAFGKVKGAKDVSPVIME